jgi:transporter family protein
VFLILSGLATGASWLCYFRALQLGDVNKVVPVDKSSTILTILLALVLLGEGITWAKAGYRRRAGRRHLADDQKKETTEERDTKNKAWLIYTALAAVFASLTAILAKIGIRDVESNLGTPSVPSWY